MCGVTDRERERERMGREVTVVAVESEGVVVESLKETADAQLCRHKGERSEGEKPEGGAEKKR